MRQPVQRIIVLLLLALTVTFGGSRASADDRTDARTHYQSGVKFYASADYKSAIREFSAAQQLLPADLNNYNLALCYDKLGDAEPAVQYYREYLNRVPSSDKRAEIEASIARLDSALKSAAAKKAEEQRKIDEAHKADEAKKAEEERKIEDAAKADEAKRAAEAKKDDHKVVGTVMGGPAVGAGAGVGVGVGAGVSGGVATGVGVGVGSTGVPSTGQTVSTGDAQLDRVSTIDINAIRDQRVGGAGSGLADNRGGPATGAVGVGGSMNGQANINGQGNVNGMAATGAGGAPQGPLPTDKPAAPQETPVYKKWWFWVVVGVSALVVYNVATTSSNNNTPVRGRELPPMSPGSQISAGGLPLFHF